VPPPAAVSDEDRERIAAEARAAHEADIAAYLAEQARIADESQLSEVERRELEADRREVAATERENIAALALAGTRVERALLIHGVPAVSVATVARMVPVTVDMTDAEAVAAVETLRTAVPAVFTATAPPPAAPPGTPHTAPPLGGQGNGPTGLEAGRQKARDAAPKTSDGGKFPHLRSA